MVVVSHLFSGFKRFRGRCDFYESNLPLFRTIYFPTAPFVVILIIIVLAISQYMVSSYNDVYYVCGGWIYG